MEAGEKGRANYTLLELVLWSVSIAVLLWLNFLPHNFHLDEGDFELQYGWPIRFIYLGFDDFSPTVVFCDNAAIDLAGLLGNIVFWLGFLGVITWLLRRFIHVSVLAVPPVPAQPPVAPKEKDPEQDK